MGNSHHPLDKLPLLFVLSGTKGIYNLDEGILKQILGELFILNNHKDISKDAVLVTTDDNFKGGFISGNISADQILITNDMGLHWASFLNQKRV
jgi:hypothetical protein